MIWLVNSVVVFVYCLVGFAGGLMFAVADLNVAGLDYFVLLLCWWFCGFCGILVFRVVCGVGLVILMHRILLGLVVMVVYGFYLCSTVLCCAGYCFGLRFV